MSPIDAAELITMLKQMELEDPLDLTNVPASIGELQTLVAKNVVMQVNGLQEAEFSEDHQMVLMQVITARLLLENLVLRLNIEVSNGRNPQEALRLLKQKLDTSEPAPPPNKVPSSIILPDHLRV
jgi:hypothetical protein